MKLTSTYKKQPPVLCRTPSFAAAALEVRAKTESKLTFPPGDKSKPHSLDPDLPRCQKAPPVWQDLVLITQLLAIVSATLYNHLMCKEAVLPVTC